MTRRLYWDDPLLLSFEAPLLAQATSEGRPALVFEATAFYPEAGGQLADRGRARWDGGEAAIVDAREDAAGRVLHVLDLAAGAALPAAGAPVQVTIDELRRRDHMSQHTGQHLLSRALVDLAGAATSSSRLGDSVCTIDTPLETLRDEALADAQALVTRVVLEDRPVRQLRPTPEELARLPLRRDPKVTTNVRIIDIDGFDLSPCGGTHAVRTGQVGPVRIVGVERHKGGLRLSFLTGRRALADVTAKERVLTGLARDFTCGWAELPGAIDRLRTDARDQAKALERLRGELAVLVARTLVEAAPLVNGIRFVAAAVADPELARATAAAIAAQPEAAAILWASTPEGVFVVVQRGDAATRFDAGAVFKRLAAACGGRGGGRPHRAEGRLPAGSEPTAAVAAERALAAG